MWSAEAYKRPYHLKLDGSTPPVCGRRDGGPAYFTLEIFMNAPVLRCAWCLETIAGTVAAIGLIGLCLTEA